MGHRAQLGRTRLCFSQQTSSGEVINGSKADPHLLGLSVPRETSALGSAADQKMSNAQLRPAAIPMQHTSCGLNGVSGPSAAP